MLTTDLPDSMVHEAGVELPISIMRMLAGHHVHRDVMKALCEGHLRDLLGARPVAPKPDLR